MLRGRLARRIRVNNACRMNIRTLEQLSVYMTRKLSQAEFSRRARATRPQEFRECKDRRSHIEGTKKTNVQASRCMKTRTDYSEYFRFLRAPFNVPSWTRVSNFGVSPALCLGR